MKVRVNGLELHRREAVVELLEAELHRLEELVRALRDVEAEAHAEGASPPLASPGRRRTLRSVGRGIDNSLAHARGRLYVAIEAVRLGLSRAWAREVAAQTTAMVSAEIVHEWRFWRRAEIRDSAAANLAYLTSDAEARAVLNDREHDLAEARVAAESATLNSEASIERRVAELVRLMKETPCS